MIIDDTLRCVDANGAAAELVGRPRTELIGASVAAGPEVERGVLEPLARKLVARGELSGTIEVERPDGTQRIVEVDRASELPSRPPSVRRAGRDRAARPRDPVPPGPTPRRGRAPRGGVAHDFNNLLTAISGYAEFLRETLGHDHAGQRDVTEITRASERAAVSSRSS